MASPSKVLRQKFLNPSSHKKPGYQIQSNFSWKGVLLNRNLKRSLIKLGFNFLIARGNMIDWGITSTRSDRFSHDLMTTLLVLPILGNSSLFFTTS